MEKITYSLTDNELNSDLYYEEIRPFSKKIISEILSSGDKYLTDFMDFIMKNNIESIRSKEEYGIELLLIGVIINQYLDYGHAFKYSTENVFSVLNLLRENESYKEKVDDLRGLLASDILLRKKKVNKALDLEDFNLIVKWMKATGDFKEEVYRLINFQQYLNNKDDKYIKELFDFCLEKIEYLYKECRKVLGKYTSNVEKYLLSYKESHINKEDVIYCGKGEIHYFFNMVSAEVMNQVYRNDFISCKRKCIFLPTCMRQTEKKCFGETGEWGYTCRECNEGCNVNKLKKSLKNSNIEVYTIPHETMLFKSKDSERKVIGIIGVACVTNLISGGWKALRMGFKPQCVILDYCGCSKHWLKEPLMTSININQLERILSGK